jgi:hypothetical protein
MISKTYENPWLFNGEPFLDCGKYAGFVYLLIDKVTGKRYIGKKFFWCKRKVPNKKRRVTVESNWREYYSSCDEIKKLVKEHGKQRFERHILSLHELERDVNYMEIKLQYMLGVLEKTDEEGNMLYYNGNISGKHHAHLVRGIEGRMNAIDPKVLKSLVI